VLALGDELDDIAGDDVSDRDPPAPQHHMLVWPWYGHPPTVPLARKPGQVWVRTSGAGHWVGFRPGPRS
jgi:hypothetical protein